MKFPVCLGAVLLAGCNAVWEGGEFRMVATGASAAAAACQGVDEATCQALPPPAAVAISSDVHIVTEQELAERIAALSPPVAVTLAKRTAYAEAIRQAARRHAVDVPLIYAVIHAESAFDPAAVSPAGAQGLMQLMPATASLMKVSDAFDPAQNIAGGVGYLRLMLDRFQDTTLALAAYNAGPENVLRFGLAVPPFAETQQYLQRVERLYSGYRQLID